MGQLALSKSVRRTISKLRENTFLFQQLVNRDFQQRYKRTVLGMAWSVLSPLCQLLVMMFMFKNLFGRTVNHYVIYMFAGNIVWSYFTESTNNGMTSLMNNAGVISKINVPKYLFLLSQNVSALINFGLTVIIFFCFCIGDGIRFTPAMLMLWYPVLCLVVMNVGIGMVLSALFVFFRDIQYLYRIFLTILNYMCAIFYTLDHFSAEIQRLFLINPVYANIKYWRVVVLDGNIPSPEYHLLLACDALFFLAIGAYFYKHYNHRFIYYF